MDDLDFLVDEGGMDEKYFQLMQEQAKLKKGILTVHKSTKLIQTQLKSMIHSIEDIEFLFEDNRRQLDKLQGIVEGMSRGGISVNTNIDGDVKGDVAGGEIKK